MMFRLCLSKSDSFIVRISSLVSNSAIVISEKLSSLITLPVAVFKGGGTGGGFLSIKKEADFYTLGGLDPFSDSTLITDFI